MGVGGGDLEGGADEIALAHEPAFQLGPLMVSPPTREVRAKGRVETVEPRVMQVLVCLAQSAGQVVSRDDLIQRCWGGRIVGEDAINRCIAKVRRIADMTDEPTFLIDTIPRVGYRLNRSAPEEAPVIAAPPSIVSHGLPPAAKSGARRRWVFAALMSVALAIGVAAVKMLAPAPVVPWSAEDQRMSFAVRPLAANADDAALADYASSLTDELTAGLSSESAVGTILPRSKVMSVDLAGGPDVVGRRLKVAYFIEGTVRHQGNDYETSLSIINVKTGALLGTERLVEPVGPRDPLRETLMRAVATLAGYGIKAEYDRIQALPESRRDARDLLISMEALKVWNNGLEGANALVELSDKAVALAPDEPHVLGWAADNLAYRAGNGWSANPEADIRRASALADRALAKDARNMEALRAEILIFMAEGRNEEGIAIADRIIAANPYLRNAYHNKALGLMRLGRGEEALATMTMMPHNADNDMPVTQQIFGEIYLLLGRYAEAAACLRTAMVGLSPADYHDVNSAGILIELAAAEVQLGRTDLARQVLKEFVTANPNEATISAVRRQAPYFMDLMNPDAAPPPVVETIFSALRKAGMAE